MGACCTSQKISFDSIFFENFSKTISEKDENISDIDWKYKVDKNWFHPKNNPILSNKKKLGDDMLVYLDCFNTECALNQFNLLKDPINWPLTTIGIIKATFNQNGLNKEKLGTGILINPFIVLTLIQNAYILEKGKKNNYELEKARDYKFYSNFNGEEGYESNIDDIVHNIKIENLNENNFVGMCLLILSNPIGLQVGYVGLPRFLKNENNYNYAKLQSTRENRRENQSIEINGHTFYRIEKKIYLFESKVFCKKILNEENKNILHLSGISFDALPGAPLWYPKNEKKILMGLFSHTNKENENIGLLLEDHLNELIFSLENYLENKKLQKKIEIVLNNDIYSSDDLDRIVEFIGINYPNVKRYSIKNLTINDICLVYLDKSFTNFFNLKYLSLENNSLYKNMDLDFKNLISLNELNLSYNQVSQSTIISICKNLKNLRQLKLIKCNIDDESLNFISEKLLILDTLALNYNNITDSGVCLLMKSLIYLKELYLKGNSLGDECLEAFHSSLLFLEVISLNENKITNDGIYKIVQARTKKLFYLKKIYLSKNNFTDDGVKLFKDIINLVDELDITENNINNYLMKEFNRVSCI